MEARSVSIFASNVVATAFAGKHEQVVLRGGDKTAPLVVSACRVRIGNVIPT